MSGESMAGDLAAVSAVILHYHREPALAAMLERLRPLALGEIIVVDNGSAAGLDGIVGDDSRIRVLDPGRNIGIAGRNLAAREARGDFLLMLDDDAYPEPGAVEAALETFRVEPRVAVVGGLVRDVDRSGKVLQADGIGSFDWFLRAGQRGEAPPAGFPAFFYPEGACVMRREAFLAVGGYFEPFFWGCTELDVTTRLVARGWEVCYQPRAVFDHMRVRLPGDPMSDSDRLRYRWRNQLWYFWLRFPSSLAARRIPAYLAFDTVEAIHRRELRTLWRAVREAWMLRGTVREYRDPLPREALRRAEMNRGRMHVRLLVGQAGKKLRRR